MDPRLAPGVLLAATAGAVAVRAPTGDRFRLRLPAENTGRTPTPWDLLSRPDVLGGLRDRGLSAGAGMASDIGGDDEVWAAVEAEVRAAFRGTPSPETPSRTPPPAPASGPGTAADPPPVTTLIEGRTVLLVPTAARADLVARRIAAADDPDVERALLTGDGVRGPHALTTADLPLLRRAAREHASAGEPPRWMRVTRVDLETGEIDAHPLLPLPEATVAGATR